jgi:hypothetical protein
VAQLPERLRQADQQDHLPVLVRTDATGATHTFTTHLATRGVEFSLSANLGHFDIPTTLALLPTAVWSPAYQARKPRAAEHGIQIETRDGAWVAELTQLVDLSSWAPRDLADPAQRMPAPRRAAAHRE